MSHRSLVASIAIGAVAMAVLAFPVPALAQQAAAYSNGFEDPSDVADWYLSYDDWNGIQWWNVDDNPIGGHSGTSSLNYNNGTDINGDYPYAYFQVQTIDLTGMTDPMLTWWCYYELNSDPYFDYREIYMYEFYNYEYIYRMFNGDGDGDGNIDIDCGAMNEWHQHSIALPASFVQSGTFFMQFYTYSNGYYQGDGLDGWFIDDMFILVPDTTPPDTINDLAAGGETLTTIDVTWSAPHDDDISGVVDSYDLRYSLTPINATNFDSATPVAGEPSPDVEGTQHTKTVTNLLEDTTYFFAIRSTDIAGNMSLISNVATVTTLAPPPPPPPPSTPASTFGPPEETKDILPCAAGTSAAPTGLLALAGLIALAALAGALRK